MLCSLCQIIPGYDSSLCWLTVLFYSGCAFSGSWYGWDFQLYPRDFDYYLKSLWVLFKSFSNQSPCLGLAHGSWPDFCRLWFQWQFNFLSLCDATLICFVYLVSLGVPVFQPEISMDITKSPWGENHPQVRTITLLKPEEFNALHIEQAMIL